MIEKIKLSLLQLFALVFTLTFSFIFAEALVRPNDTFLAMTWWKVGLLAIIIFSFLVIAYRWMNRLGKRGLIIFTVINFFILVLLQAFFIRYFQVNPTWDVGDVYRTALEQKNIFDSLPDYFTVRYPNNIPLLTFFILGMRFLDLFGITDYYFYFTIFNAFAIVLTLGCLYWFINRRLGLVSATWTSLLMLFISPLYMYVPIVYTDTLVMLFPILGLIFYDLFYHSRNGWRYLYLILLGLILAVGVLVKTNAIIIVVAIMIHYVMRNPLKKWIQLLIGVALPFILVNVIYQGIMSPLYPNGKEELGFPMTHWVMMGLEGNGGYYHQDVEYTLSLKYAGLTNEEIKDIHIDRIKDRLSDYGIKGFLDHLHKKINYTWAEGTYFVPEKLRREPINTNGYQSYIFGEKNEIYIYSAQAVHLVILGLMALSGAYLLKNRNSFLYVAAIAIFGNFLFLMMWETRSRYLVLYLPLMMMLCAYAMAHFNKIKSKESLDNV